MPPIYLRGGLPRKVSGDANTSDWSEYPVPGGNANAVILKNTGANIVLFALSKEMRDKDEGWAVAVSGETTLLPAELGSIWVKSTGGASTFDALVFVRRG